MEKVRNEVENYEKNMDIRNNNAYTTGNLLNFAYFQKDYGVIATDFGQKTKLKDQ